MVFQYAFFLIEIPSLKLILPYHFLNSFTKINQVEIDKNYAYISVSIEEPKPIDAKVFIGVDRNTTGHIAVAANPDTGKVYKLGKEALHIHNKYKGMRRKLQKAGVRSFEEDKKQGEEHNQRHKPQSCG